MRITTAWALAWVSCAVAISVGIIVSKSIIPLWFLIVPLCISIKAEEKK